MINHLNIGKKGEEYAANYLAEKGYKILRRNWRYKKKEIDIICEKDQFLVVVEVKTRSSEGDERPEELVTLRKQKFLIEATEAYMYGHGIDTEVRFDVILVIIKNNACQLDHIVDAFYPLA